MGLRTAVTAAALAGMVAMLGPTLAAAQSASAPPPDPRFSNAVYNGHRASRLIGSAVFSRRGEYLGEVGNVIMADSGQIVSLLLEGSGAGDDSEFVFQLPWARMVRPLEPGALVADFSDLRSREYGLFFVPRQNTASRHEFPISRIIGDYVRLQAGQGFGHVSDLVFDDGGKLRAVVVSHDAAAGGGTYAFPYPGTTGDWNPDMSYYGLPYVTNKQASQTGLRIDMRKFRRQS